MINDHTKWISAAFAIYLLFLAGQISFGQPGCPAIDAGPNVTVGCGNNCTTLTATVVPTGATSSYAVSGIPYTPPFSFNGGNPIIINIDDVWSDIVPLPFTFCFYNNSYNQIVVGSNGVISFDMTYANGGCQWMYSDPCPSSNIPLNAIFGVYQDIDPTYQGVINWQLSGAYPCRMFVISYYEIPYFGDPNSVSPTIYCSNPLFATSQMVIYESTNVIEVYIQDKELCPSWNTGSGLVGIQDATGTNGIAAPGRNTSQWTAQNEAWRFYPNGSAGYTITWWDGGTQIGTGASVQVCPNATTTYTAQAVYNTCTGNTVTVTDQVTVNYNGNFAISATPDTAALCPGDHVIITATAPPNVTFTWSPSAGLNTTSGPTVTATPNTTTIYTVTGVDPTNCSMSVPITVTVNPNPVITIDPPNPAVCNGVSVDLTAQGASSYVWSPGTGLSSTTDSTVTASPSATTTYVVTGTSNGCTGQGSVTVSISPSLNLSVSPPDSYICFGDSVILTASGADSYFWSPAGFLSSDTGVSVTVFPPSSTTFTVSGTSIGGCTGSTLVTVNLSTGALISFTPPDPIICEGASILIQAHGASNYSWSPGSGLSATTGDSVVASPISTITYTVTGDPNGCTGTAELTVTVDPIPDVDFVSDITEGCEDLMVSFHDQSHPLPAGWYWDFGDGTTPNAYTHVPNPQHLYTDYGKYDVTLLVTSFNGCQSQMTIPEMITVFKEPIANFYPDPDHAWILQPEINFFNESINTNAWAWDFGEPYVLDNLSNELSPGHTYSDTGVYTIILAVTSPDGCVDTMRKTIYIEPLISFYIPNAFTPNNDGKNDLFMCMGTGINEETFTMRIFNRWGQEVFFNADIYNGWNGNLKGSDQKSPEGVYCYTVSFKDINANLHQYKGFVTLIR